MLSSKNRFEIGKLNPGPTFEFEKVRNSNSGKKLELDSTRNIDFEFRIGLKHIYNRSLSLWLFHKHTFTHTKTHTNTHTQLHAHKTYLRQFRIKSQLHYQTNYHIPLLR